MPSTPLDAYGLMLSACQDPNPVMFLEPKALLRMQGRGAHPRRARTTTARSRKMIDAPLGDRAQWKPQWPDAAPSYAVPIGKGEDRPRGQRRHGGQLRPHAARCA